jgi:aspartyl-tRNA(Asn)/glutamyl-tRNA(Gln) amidotransferase subunit C
MIKPEEVEKLARLARIELSDEEKSTFSGEIDAILSYVSDIQKLGASVDVREVSSVRNVLREDTDAHESGAYTEAILKEAPAREGNYVRVKRIL